MAQLFRATEEFSTTVDGISVNIHLGDLFDANDPVLKGRQQLFEPYEPKARDYGRVEQATAAPGERRNR